MIIASCSFTIGGGHRFNDLADGAKARGLEHMWRFRPYQEREALNLSLCVPDLHWISLKPASPLGAAIAAIGRPAAATP
jgi:hypothetical protein